MNTFDKSVERACPICGTFYSELDLQESNGSYRCEGCGNIIYFANPRPGRGKRTLNSFLARRVRDERRFGSRA